MNKPWLNYYDSYVPESLDYPQKSMYEAVKATSTAYPDHTAYVFLGKSCTYKKFVSDIDHVAAILHHLGLNKNDRITLCMPNIPSALIAFYAINRIGAVASMIHPLSTAKEIEYYLKLSESTWAMTLDAFYPNFNEIIDNTSVNKIIVARLTDYLSPVKGFLFKLTKGKKIKKIPDSDKNIYWKNILKTKSTTTIQSDHNVKEMAVILYSGGTTGNPKGIMLSSYNINALATQIKFVGPMEPGDKMLSILPVFHGFGLAIGIHAVLISGATSILVPKFDAKIVASMIKKEKPQFVAGVPTLYEALLREPKVKKADFSSFKFIASGGDSLPSHTKRKFDEFIKKRGAKTHLREGYGLTESVTANCVMPENHYRKGSVGIPIPDMELKIVKPGTTETVSHGTEGEICVHGPTVMLGYLNDPGENKKALQTHADKRTWLHTGDMGRMDEDGFVYFSIRTKRIIKVSGMGVYPPQIEDALSSHPLVSMSCAIGVPDEYKMNRVKAYVVLHDPEVNKKKIEQELHELCKRDLNKWSVPTEFEFTDSLPLTRIGKVDYNKLEKEERAKAS